jgi:hypothetical protein
MWRLGQGPGIIPYLGYESAPNTKVVGPDRPSPPAVFDDVPSSRRFDADSVNRNHFSLAIPASFYVDLENFLFRLFVPFVSVDPWPTLAPASSVPVAVVLPKYDSPQKGLETASAQETTIAGVTSAEWQAVTPDNDPPASIQPTANDDPSMVADFGSAPSALPDLAVSAGRFLEVSISIPTLPAQETSGVTTSSPTKTLEAANSLTSLPTTLPEPLGERSSMPTLP